MCGMWGSGCCCLIGGPIIIICRSLCLYHVTQIKSQTPGIANMSSIGRPINSAGLKERRQRYPGNSQLSQIAEIIEYPACRKES